MRLKKILRWWSDESGLVLGFSAILMPVILGLGVLIIQSGQLYIRQSELQFLARQTANSALVPVATAITAQAQANRAALCSVEPPQPSVCGSTRWQDFVTASEVHVLVNTEVLYLRVATEIEDFGLNFDPQAALQAENFDFEFPILSASDRVSVKVELAEPQTWWLGKVLSVDDYYLKAQSLSYLNLSA